MPVRRAQWEGGPDVPPEFLENQNESESYRQLDAEGRPQDAESAAFVLTEMPPMADRPVLDRSGASGRNTQEFVAAISCRILAPEVATGRLVERELYFLY